jgi:DNA-binding transcriptional ArsR family regulator
MALSPTLWRTCRVLSGTTRLSLLQRIIRSPGLCVSDLAAAEGISLGRASQELRRLQSRGLVRVERILRYVRYYPESDPLVASAKPILEAMKRVVESSNRNAMDLAQKYALGLTHPRREGIIRLLKNGPLGDSELKAQSRMGFQSFWHHMSLLRETGWIEMEKSERRWQLKPGKSPLATCLLELV